VALAQLHSGDHAVPLQALGPSDGAAPALTLIEQPLRPCERDQRIADLMNALSVGRAPSGPTLLASDSTHSSTPAAKPARAAQQPCPPSLESPPASALSQATTAESGRYRCTGGAARNGATAGGQRRADNKLEGRYVAPSAGAVGDRSVPSVGGCRGGCDDRGQRRPRLPFASLGDDWEVEEDLECDAGEQSYGNLDESMPDEAAPVAEEDPFDAAAAAVLAAARSRHVRGSGPSRSRQQSLAPAAFTAATASQNESLDLDSTMGGSFTAETSLDLFRYAEKQASDQLASASAACQKVARADDSLRARRAAESPAAAASASSAVAMPVEVLREPAVAHRAPRALPPRPPKSHPALAPPAAAPAAAPMPAAKPTSARLAAGALEVRRAASDAGPALHARQLGGDAPRPRHGLARPSDRGAGPALRSNAAPPGAQCDVESGAQSGAEQRSVGVRAASRQREQEELMQERKLEASLDRLDSKLAQYRARRHAGADSDSASCLSAMSRAHSTVSAPPRVQSAAAVVQRLRSATRDAAQGVYGEEEPPCKRHGLLSCRLCAEEALRPPTRKPAVYKAAVLLPPPPRRVRSAHLPNRTQVCSYTSARQLSGGLPLCAGNGQGTVARALQAARAEQQPHRCPPRAPLPPANADLPPGVPTWPAAPLPYGVHPAQQMAPLTADHNLGAYARGPVPAGAAGWPPPLNPHMGAEMMMSYQQAYAHFLYGPPPGLAPASAQPFPPFPNNGNISEGKPPASRAQAQKGAGSGGTIVVVAPNSRSLLFGDEHSE
jgi:hypothetical protein